jgi:hypothetical protein
LTDVGDTTSASKMPPPAPSFPPAKRRKKERSGAAEEGRQPPAAGSSTPKNRLVARLASLVDSRLAAFREELFPGRTVRPPLRGQDRGRSSPSVPPPVTSANGGGGKKKGGRGGGPKPALSLSKRKGGA